MCSSIELQFTVTVTSVENEDGMCLTRLWDWRTDMRSVLVTTRETGTVRGTARIPHFSLAIISVTVQLRTQVFWVRSVYFNVRNILRKSGTFPLGHSVYSVVILNVVFATLNPYQQLSVKKINSGRPKRPILKSLCLSERKKSNKL